MAGSEGASGLWGRVRERLAPYGQLRRVEHALEPGWPDVVYCLRVPARPAATGWLELKHLGRWPVRPATRVVVDTLTRDQVEWCSSWTAAGGRADLLLQAGPDYALLDACAVRALYRRELTREALLASARVVGCRRFPTRELVRHLTRA